MKLELFIGSITLFLIANTYYDGKISLLIWILLCGLKCILDEEKIQVNEKAKNYQIGLKTRMDVLVIGIIILMN